MLSKFHRLSHWRCRDCKSQNKKHICAERTGGIAKAFGWAEPRSEQEVGKVVAIGSGPRMFVKNLHLEMFNITGELLAAAACVPFWHIEGQETCRVLFEGKKKKKKFVYFRRGFLELLGGQSRD